MKYELLISFASWEERFFLGCRSTLSDFQISEVVVFHLSEYDQRTQKNRKALSDHCHDISVPCEFQQLRAEDPAESWRTVVEYLALASGKTSQTKVLLDISTMPREMIWYICWVLSVNNCLVKYLYYSPEQYTDGWLSRDPRTPRMVYKLGGMSRPDRSTALLVTIGFDPDRAGTIVNWLEPAKLLFGIQLESPFERNQELMENYRSTLKERYDCELFELDSFGDDCGQRAIENAISPYVDSHNVVMTSLGPKLTAISLFKIQRQTDSTSLVYAPATQFNENYSRGLGQRYLGVVSE